MATENFLVQGFRAAAVNSGIRGKDRLDLALIVSDKPATVAGVFTTSLVKAAPVLLDMERCKTGKAQAILVNSGIANACTGEEGMRLARLTTAMAADALNIAPELVQVCSTGIIGQQLELACFQRGIPKAAQSLVGDGLADVAQAIMTTDTFRKIAVRTALIDGKPVKLLGMAKGAGMIMPNMATMLSFILTDAKIDHDLLQSVLKKVVAKTFNAITVDGDTSTNDTVLLMANGLAEHPPIAENRPEALAAFAAALEELCKELALLVVRDGEGATKLVTIRVRGAVTEAQADQAARTVANSNLVKTAFFGEDANWGRIIAALGRSGAQFDQSRVDIAFDDVFMVQNGLGQGAEVEARATAVLKKPEFVVTIDLHAGDGSKDIYTCDFSLDYVKINADYRS
ncbi:bifunctional glutamate N-acetyltransferase/amino-acid acetyltransferase ArgJ [Thiovibrio frasassiensis]|uniref:Arginine biosynthesis bifunctional protein ArgJ n=1 Tax=Thiovibrio frasassiensis TaxID=2984131 RepID=A0A9X4RKP7_9BACT|nr:bifunctional glutamate N-acetyltransferase/amino-acid acetyltransferase ArgJ [Thiovibrio frasassiensis]MDG4474755.1 bifunctional glutamate N-acetyltransferase/amino-acid acetyltransferase ArgJ [Thiovibrio frasassiensis]